MQPVSGTIDISVNEEPRRLPAGTQLAALLDELGLSARQGLAVAVNATVVPRAGWGERALCTGDEVLIIQASQGG